MATMLPLLLLLLLLLPPSSVVASSKPRSSFFSLDFFPGDGDGAVSQLSLSNAAPASSSGAISMSSPHAQVQYKKPITFVGAFSTYFSFSLRPSASLAFFLSPPSAPKALAVVFAAEEANSTSTARIDLAGRAAVSVHTRGLLLLPKMHSWIDYNSSSGTLQVRLSASHLPKPPPALLSCRLDLPALLRRRNAMPMPMVVRAGFASSGASNCTLFSWAFQATTTAAPYLMHSQPLDPSDLHTTPPPERRHRPRRSYGYRYPWGWGAAASLLLAVACGAMLTFLLLFVWHSVVARRRRPVAPVDPCPCDVVYEKIVLVGAKDHAAGAGGGNNK